MLSFHVWKSIHSCVFAFAKFKGGKSFLLSFAHSLLSQKVVVFPFETLKKKKERIYTAAIVLLLRFRYRASFFLDGQGCSD